MHWDLAKDRRRKLVQCCQLSWHGQVADAHFTKNTRGNFLLKTYPGSPWTQEIWNLLNVTFYFFCKTSLNRFQFWLFTLLRVEWQPNFWLDMEECMAARALHHSVRIQCGGHLVIPWRVKLLPIIKTRVVSWLWGAIEVSFIHAVERFVKTRHAATCPDGLNTEVCVSRIVTGSWNIARPFVWPIWILINSIIIGCQGRTIGVLGCVYDCRLFCARRICLSTKKRFLFWKIRQNSNISGPEEKG